LCYCCLIIQAFQSYLLNHFAKIKSTPAITSRYRPDSHSCSSCAAHNSTPQPHQPHQWSTTPKHVTPPLPPLSPAQLSSPRRSAGADLGPDVLRLRVGARALAHHSRECAFVHAAPHQRFGHATGCDAMDGMRLTHADGRDRRHAPRGERHGGGREEGGGQAHRGGDRGAEVRAAA